MRAARECDALLWRENEATFGPGVTLRCGDGCGVMMTLLAPCSSGSFAKAFRQRNS